VSLSVGGADDFEYYLRLVVSADYFSFVPEVLFHLRVHESDRLSTGAPSSEGLTATLRGRELAYNHLSKSKYWSTELAEAYLVKCRTTYVTALRYGDIEQIKSLESWLLPICPICENGKSILVIRRLRKILGARFLGRMIVIFVSVKGVLGFR